MTQSYVFPVPRITESFVDGVARKVGWQRYSDLRQPLPGESNADYVAGQDVIELKIFEEEGLEKQERQSKIADLYKRHKSSSVVDVSLEESPGDIRRELEGIVSGPIKTAVKKASKQIQLSRELLGLSGCGVLLAINNGYSYLNAENFERLVVRRCLNDTSGISFAICITVAYHQGDFDGYVFCKASCKPVKGSAEWAGYESFMHAFYEAFNAAMGVMMRDQLDPRIWDHRLEPVATIRFVHDGVTYERRAPEVPDSRFK